MVRGNKLIRRDGGPTSARAADGRAVQPAGCVDARPDAARASGTETAFCLFNKRIDQGGFVWPVMAGFDSSITLTPAQLAMLIEGIDWRAPERLWKPAIA